MTIKTVLAPLYDSALDTVVVDAAAKLAAQFNAHLETLLMRVSVDVASEFICSRIYMPSAANIAASLLWTRSSAIATISSQTRVIGESLCAGEV